MFSFATIAT